jgi:hypothetical protein
VLPQVQFGLGVFSVLSAGCLLWLERLQPVFFAAAVASLAYQGWLFARRPPSARTRTVKAILAVSVALNVILITGWIVFSIRYQ